jgi:phosphoribosyl 1,2-cyclic phosphate phosphodiesterase
MIPEMASYPEVRVTVLGSGTSTGVPVINCPCPVCASDNPKNKRLRSSIKVEIGASTFLIDCGVDFRQQMLKFRTPRIDAVLVTHTHADHVHGIDDLRAYCFRQMEHIPIYTTRPFIRDIETRFAYAFNPMQTGGGVPMLNMQEIQPGELIEIQEIPILPVRIMHGKLPILGFRFGQFAYLTDCSGIPDETVEQLDGVETIIISALRDRPHPTHFNFDQAMEAAQRMGAKTAYFIHFTCSVDHDSTEAKLPDWARLTYDGLEIVMPAYQGD